MSQCKSTNKRESEGEENAWERLKLDGWRRDLYFMYMCVRARLSHPTRPLRGESGRVVENTAPSSVWCTPWFWGWAQGTAGSLSLPKMGLHDTKPSQKSCLLKRERGKEARREEKRESVPFLLYKPLWPFRCDICSQISGVLGDLISMKCNRLWTAVPVFVCVCVCSYYLFEWASANVAICVCIFICVNM